MGRQDETNRGRTHSPKTLTTVHEDEAFSSSPEVSESTSLLESAQHGQRGPIDPSARKHSWVGFEEFDGLPWHKRPSVYWLIGPFALYTLAFGGSLVPKLNLIIDLVCQRYFADRAAADPSLILTPIMMGGENPQCRTPGVQRDVATFMLVLGVITGTLSAITAPKIGGLSDRYGRRRLMALSSAGGILGELLTIAAGNFPDVVHYKWLVLGSFLDGLGGSFTAGSVLSNSYTSDCTPPSQRSVAMGMIHSCFFVGMAVGPLVAGYFVKWTGSLLSVFYVSLGCHVCFILFMLLVIPESLSKRRQYAARDKHAVEQDIQRKSKEAWIASVQLDTANRLEVSRLGWRVVHHTNSVILLASIRQFNPFAPLKVLWPKGPGTRLARRNLVLFAMIDVVILGLAMSAGQVTLLYSEYQFEWGNFETSRFISLISTVRVIALMVMFPIINYIFRIRPTRQRERLTGVVAIEKNAGADNLDIWILRFAILSDVIGITGYVLARSVPLFVLSGVITAFGGLGSATIQAALSKHVPAERVGKLLGAIGLLHALSRVFAPALLNGLYAGTVGTFPQAVFVLLASMFALALLLSLMVKPHVYIKDDADIAAEERDQDPATLNGESRRNFAAQEALNEDGITPRVG